MSKSKKISKKSNNAANNSINLEKIRQAGICRHYEQLKDQGLSPRECLKKTAEFARISERHTKGILTDQKQSTGRKTGSVSQYFEKIEDAAIKSKKMEDKKIDQIYNKIRREIQNDPGLNGEEKSALTEELDRSEQETKALSSSHNKTPEEPEFKSFADLVKNVKI